MLSHGPTRWQRPYKSLRFLGRLTAPPLASMYVCANSDLLPCLWLHGIIPESLTAVSDEFPPSRNTNIVNVTPDDCQWSSGTYYGDASGCEHTMYPKLRRIGVGLVRIGRDGSLSFGVKSNLPGEVQTVARGETSIGSPSQPCGSIFMHWLCHWQLWGFQSFQQRCPELPIFFQC